ncbi:hypothetical protein DDB_G0287867 [Dictyostelium discoideum AX4]|uniref:Putative uncharacterized protein DDB_G0287867 n=1 Tax=Dictyostelium discoideum TaxID=44689 RepID=Y7638_DICDI|nr:hypothetical protein DDB_G0287867 [Dictyostelium discoideum AX4]Q54JU6.1 RecName: Full=Putative uncharacterized protein DDB_G0287867 [Dictyostelium discoideum]EAL63580.1 hypothetical protein DDB_G0287867 [Dictyostelium discoideum AX4]|eukprot:XP_637056.1 hypothetical protein DDB_G0287867 [Dictyostelium discoideum AX4]
MKLLNFKIIIIQDVLCNNKDYKDNNYNNNKIERLTTSALSRSANRIPTTSSTSTSGTIPTTTITPRQSIINNRNQIINKPQKQHHLLVQIEIH